MTPIQRDFVELVFVFVITCAGLFGCIIVYRNENRRRLRLRFREILEARLPASEELERKLAEQIGEALRHQNIPTLEKVTLVPYLEDYIVDFEFKQNLYSFLFDYVREHKLRLSADDLQKILAVTNIWREKENDLEIAVFRHLDSASIREKDAKQVRQFIGSRPKYFENKTNDFVDDVKEVIQLVAARS